MLASARHSHNLDRLRLVAITDIVLYHVNYFEPRYLLGLGLPTFLVSATMLGCAHVKPRRWRDVTGPRVRRIVLPWLFWSGVYGVSLGLREAMFNEWRVWYRPFEPLMLAYGTAIHLWFLPFIFVAALAVRGLHGLTWRADWRLVVGGGLAAGAVAACIPSPLSWVFPWESWWFAFPCMPLGLALGRLIAEGQLQHPWTLMLAVAAAVLGGFYCVEHGLSPPIGRFALATALIVLALWFPSWPDPVTTRLTPLVYGVFLIHPLLLLLTHDVVREPSYALLAVTGLAGSAGVIALLRRTPLRAVT